MALVAKAAEKKIEKQPHAKNKNEPVQDRQDQDGRVRRYGATSS
jgi:hypothetical protein